MNKLIFTQALSGIISRSGLTAIERFQLTMRVADLGSEGSMADRVKKALAGAQSILESSALDDYSVRLVMTDLHLAARELQAAR